MENKKQTPQMVAGMLANNLILNQAGEITPRFIDIYTSWNQEERRYFQDEYFKKYFWGTNTIVPLWNAAKASHFNMIDEVGLTADQDFILDRTTASMINLIEVEQDVTIKVRWARLLLLRPQTRVFYAEHLAGNKLFDSAHFIDRLVTDIIGQANKKEMSWLEKLFNWSWA